MGATPELVLTWSKYSLPSSTIRPFRRRRTCRSSRRSRATSRATS
jgi:hypothetical protein